MLDEWLRTVALLIEHRALPPGVVTAGGRTPVPRGDLRLHLVQVKRRGDGASTVPVNVHHKGAAVSDRHVSTTAVRGHAITFAGDPFFDDDAFVDLGDTLIVSQDGVISAVGPYEQTKASLPEGIEVAQYPDHLLCAGFIDTHVHYVQTGIIGAYGSQLIDWLNHYTFVQEQGFADRIHADDIANRFFDELLRNGTTTAVTFCAVYPGSVDAFFEESVRRGTRMIGGKVLMDRNAPDPLLDTATTGYDDSKALIERWHGNGRNLYAITPRFAPTSTAEQLEAAGALRKEHPGTFTHTHVSENLGEIAWVRSLFPERAGYLDVYDHYGLLGPRAVLAYGVHLSERERARVHETGAAIAHCPTSNLFLGSGSSTSTTPRARSGRCTSASAPTWVPGPGSRCSPR